MTVLRAGSATDVGRRRANNQDMVLVDDPLFAVADGMGGYAGGEVASSTAIDALRETFGSSPTSEGLEAALLDANAAVQEASRESPDLRNMGTTMVAVALVHEDGADLFAVASIGDSRVYLFRAGELSKLTDDHSVAEELLRSGQISEAEAAVHPQRHMLTRVLGPGGETTPDFQKLVPYAGDRLLLCSDGLYNEVTDREMAEILATVAGPDEAARRLVALANDHGGGDNISVVVIDVVDDGDRAASASRDIGGGPLLSSAERNAALRAIGEDRPPSGGGGAGPGAAHAGPGAARRSDQQIADQNDLDNGRRVGRAGGRVAAGQWSAPLEHDVPARRITGRVVAFLVALVVILAAAVAAIGWYARGSYYVGLRDGTVAIFKGRPGGLLWFQPTVEQTTDLHEAQLPASRAGDVAAGHETTSMAEARRYVANLRDLAGLGATATTTTTVQDPASGSATSTVPPPIVAPAP